MKKKYACFLLLLIPWLSALPLSSFAQEDTTRQDKEYANPSVEGTARGKFLIFKYQRFFNYDFNSTAANTDKLPVGNANASVDKSNIAEVKGFIPLWNRPHFKTVLGVGYEREEYHFENANEDTYLYHKNLQDKGLKSLSAQLAFIHPINYKNYFVWRFKGSLNGDYTSDELNFNDYLKVTGELMYGWKKSKYFSWGIGAQAGYTFGRFSVYPAILYNRTFNDHWGIESVFPANIKMRFTPATDKTFLYFGYELDGYSYNIKVDKAPFTESPVFANIKTLELRHNDVKINARWEQEIYDFLWFGLEGGYRVNIAYDAFETGSSRKTTLIETECGGAPFAEASIFFVVPRAFLKR
jgi:hypothetical protein